LYPGISRLKMSEKIPPGPASISAAMALFVDTMTTMKRLRRWLFNVAVAGSLVLCVVTVVMWVWSYWIIHYVAWTSGDARMSAELRNEAGTVRLTFERALRGHLDFYALSEQHHPGFLFGTGRIGRPTLYGHWFAYPTDRFGYIIDYGGFAIWSGSTHAGPPREQTLLIVVPHLHLLLVELLALLTPLAVRNRLQVSRRRRMNLCTKCGYDLRATPDRCPECGTPVETPAKL
jgi:hypothetical protein